MTSACATCGKSHEGELFELAYLRPDAVVAMDSVARSAHVRESNDICVIDDERFFVRATLPLNVHESAEDYRIGVWVELPKASFERVRELWSAPDQASEPPFAAALANDVRHHPGSLGHAVLLQLTGPTTRPAVSFPDPVHPLAIEQRDGVSLHRASEYTFGSL